MFGHRGSNQEVFTSPRQQPSRSKFFFGRPESSIVSESSQDTTAPLINPQSRSRYYSFGKNTRPSAGKVTASPQISDGTFEQRQEMNSIAPQLQRSATQKPSSPILNPLNRVGTKHRRNHSAIIKRDIIGTWNDDVVQSTAGTLPDIKQYASCPNMDEICTPDRFSPLPPNLSKAAAKRLGITINIPNTVSPPPQDSPVDWALSIPTNRDDPEPGFTPALAKSTFFSSESEPDDIDTSLCSSQSSRTSYNVSTPIDLNLPSGLDEGKNPFHEPILPVENEPTTDIHMQHLPMPRRKSSKRKLRTNQPQHTPQNSTSSTNTDHSLRRTKTNQSYKPLPDRPQSMEDPIKPVTNPTADHEIQAKLTDMRSRTVEVENVPEIDQGVPAVPPRSRRRDWIKRVSTMSAPTGQNVRQEPIKQGYAPLPSIPGRWVEPQNTVSVKDDTHPAFRVQSPSPVKIDEEVPITADAAECVIIHMLESLDDLKDLFSAARTNRGFYSVFKRHELRLMKQTVKNLSPAAWEMREASVKEIISSSEDSRVDYTPTRYLQFHRRDAYILAALKSIIFVRCQSALRTTTIEALRDRTVPGAQRVDDALWRIWTFCTIFGSGKGREDDIIGQMDWLRGGPFAHFATGAESATTPSYQSRKASIASASFGRGNSGGLSLDELRDMLEMWKCVKMLLQGITGLGRVAQARKYGVFESLHGAQSEMLEDGVLAEWVAYLTTLGLSTILDLSTPSTSKTTRVFVTAQDMEWTKWKPLPNGASRANFLYEAVNRVYNEEMTAARRAARPKAFPLAPSPAPQSAPVFEAKTPAATTVVETSKANAETLMALWLQYQTRLAAAQLPVPMTAAEPTRPTATMVSSVSEGAAPSRPNLRSATSLSLFPAQDTYHHQKRSTSSASSPAAVSATSPPPPLPNNVIVGAAAAAAAAPPLPPLGSRFNAMARLGAKKSMPELRTKVRPLVVV